MQLYRSTYADIIKGYSLLDGQEGVAYVKHFKDTDYGEMDYLKNSFIEEAKRKGLLTEKERIKHIISIGDWSKKEESLIASLGSELENLEVTKRKLFIKSQIHSLNKSIKEISSELEILSNRRQSVVGYTAEKYANQRINNEYIYNSLFRDSSLKENYYNREEFDYLSNEDLSLLVIGYNSLMMSFSEKNLKRIAFQTFVLNNFFLCEDNPMIFFGKPIIDLTIYQASLFSQAKHYKYIITRDGMPPESVLNDDEQMDNWMNSGSNSVGEKLKKANTDASTIVGATKEEMSSMSDKGSTMNLSEEAEKMMREKGQESLSMQDLIKLHGH